MGQRVGRARARRPPGFIFPLRRLTALLYDYRRVRAGPPANLFILRGFARQVGPRQKERPLYDRQLEEDTSRVAAPSRKPPTVSSRFAR